MQGAINLKPEAQTTLYRVCGGGNESVTVRRISVLVVLILVIALTAVVVVVVVVVVVGVVVAVGLFLGRQAGPTKKQDCLLY